MTDLTAFRLGHWLVRPDRNCLERNGESVQLEPRIMETLVFLARQEGRVVSRRQLLDVVWGEVIVTDAALTRAISELRQALGDDPRKPRYIATVHRRGYRLLPPMIAVDEPGSVAPKPDEPEGELPMAHGAAPGPILPERIAAEPAPRGRRWVVLIVTVVVAVLVLLASWLGTRKPSGSADVPGFAGARRSVAVLGFLDLADAPETAWISTALAEILTMELAADGRLRTIAGEEVARCHLDLSDTISLSPGARRRVCEQLGADLVVVGSYLVSPGQQLRVNVRVEAGDDQMPPAVLSRNGQVSELVDMVKTVAVELRRAFGLEPLSHPLGGGAVISIPTTAEAARLYAEGLDLLRSYDARTACSRLQRAAALEPRTALVHLALAEAWSALGHDTDSAAAARTAFELRHGLWREERLLIEGRHHEQQAAWDEAIAVYEELWKYYPDNLEHGLRLATTLISSGRSREAITMLERLQELPPPAGHDARVALSEARAALLLSEYRRAVEAASNAIASGERLEAPWLVGHGMLLQGRALHALGDSAAAEAADSALRSFELLGDLNGVADVHRLQAEIDRAGGRFEAAEATLRQTLELYRDIGNQVGIIGCLNQLSGIVAGHGDPDESMALCDEALSISRRIGHLPGRVSALSNKASLLAGIRDNLDGAFELLQEALTVSRSCGNLAMVSESLSEVAVVLHRLGDLPGAIQHLSEALDLTRRVGNRFAAADLLIKIAILRRFQTDLPGAQDAVTEAQLLLDEIDYPAARALVCRELGALSFLRNDLAAARQQTSQALELTRALDLPNQAAWALVVLASIEIEQENLDAAAQHAQDAIDSFVDQERLAWEIIARSVLTRALLFAGRAEEAVAAHAVSTTLSTRCRNQEWRSEWMITEALITAVQGDLEEAIATAEIAVAEAAESGLVDEELSARLTLAAIELAAGRTTDARLHLQALEQEATTRGVLVVAARAQQMLTESKPPPWLTR